MVTPTIKERIIKQSFAVMKNLNEIQANCGCIKHVYTLIRGHVMPCGSVRWSEASRLLPQTNTNNDLVTFLEKNLVETFTFDALDKYQRSFVHYTAMANCIDLLRYLIQNGASVHDRDMWGRTPLTYAAENASLDAMKLLLAMGAEVNALDDDDTSLPPSTPLDYLLINVDITNELPDEFAATAEYLIAAGGVSVSFKAYRDGPRIFQIVERKLVWRMIFQFYHMLTTVEPGKF
ncbi:Ankyrin repeat protein [Talaromyces stipitatus ATCC 10500]|uniref:Ankyrin repeat protein n=1 Tax=Talaromyces stipitatus (strain ATCC 10500 / CBS 375.48 / QM 6759 / NRRL 1006) TaxID=441959 RepID=B8MUT5_TALSN|nr:Ankyrin repeat protein [Talaromyces stipitatus ATCC 10500]EED11855.1 Ankyrin repeat protein [Talaromyces stipitatus ATCC 10500]